MALISEFWGLDGIILFFLLIISGYVYATRNFNYWKKRCVKEIPPVPLFGNFKDVLLLKKSCAEWFEEWYKASAPLSYFGFYIVDKPLLMIRDPELIKHILIKDAHIFQDRNVSANPNDSLGDANVFFIKNPKWKYLRAKLTPVFTSGKLRKMFDLMLDVCNDFNTFLESQNAIGDGVVLEMKEVFANFTTDVIGTTAYGIRANSLNNPDADFRKHGREIFSFTTYQGYQFFAIFLAPHFTKLLNCYFFKKENVPFLRHAFWSILEERKKSGVERNDLIDILIELQNSQTEEEKKIFELDGDNLVAQAAIFFSAGFESSSTTMSFCLHKLATHPEVQDKVRREIKTALKRNKGKLTYDLVSSDLPYLDMVVAEVLRFYPALPFLDRIPSHDYKIPGSDLILEKGIPVIIPVTGLHMDESYYAEPHRFNPENFSLENSKNRNSAVYLPFGDGPHACLGQRYGLMQVKVGLITFLSNYEVLPCEKTVIPIKLNPSGILPTSNDDVYLKIRKVIE